MFTCRPSMSFDSVHDVQKDTALILINLPNILVIHQSSGEVYKMNFI